MPKVEFSRFDKFRAVVLNRRFLLTLINLLCLALITIGYSWNLVSRLTFAIPGTPKDHDVATFVWNTAWVHYALNNGADVLYSPVVFVPNGADLRLHTFGLLQGLMAFPFVGFLGVVGAYNLVLVLTLFFNGALMYWLVLRETGYPLAALPSAVFVMFGSPLLIHLTVGRPSFASIWIVLAALLIVSSLVEQPRLWKSFLLGFWLICALLSDFQIVLFSALWLLIYLPYCLVKKQKIGERLADIGKEKQKKVAEGRKPRGGVWISRRFRAVWGLLLAGLIFAVPFGLVYLPALLQTSGEGYPRPQLEDMQLYSFRWWDFFAPDTMPYAFGYELFICAISGMIILREQKNFWFWFGSGLFFSILALGPYLQPAKIPLPFAALSLWSPLSQFRTPGRLTMLGLIGFGVVAGLVLAHILPKIQSRGLVTWLVAGTIGARLIFAMVHDAFPVQIYPQYNFYRTIAADKADYTILEVPFGVRSGLDRIGQGGEVLQYYWQFHQKRLINGMIARVPAQTFSFYRQNPALLFLSGAAVSTGVAELTANLREVLKWSSARYVLVHSARLESSRLKEIENFLDQYPQLERVGTEQDLIIYRLRPF